MQQLLHRGFAKQDVVHNQIQEKQVSYPPVTRNSIVYIMFKYINNHSSFFFVLNQGFPPSGPCETPGVHARPGEGVIRSNVHMF